MKGTNYLNMEIQFDDVMFLKAVALPKDSDVKFVVMVQPGTGRFEVNATASTVCSYSNNIFYFRSPRKQVPSLLVT
jgi:fatty acid synthase, animal type